MIVNGFAPGRRPALKAPDASQRAYSACSIAVWSKVLSMGMTGRAQENVEAAQ
jgi:hypothetical protein